MEKNAGAGETMSFFFFSFNNTFYGGVCFTFLIARSMCISLISTFAQWTLFNVDFIIIYKIVGNITTWRIWIPWRVTIIKLVVPVGSKPFPLTIFFFQHFYSQFDLDLIISFVERNCHCCWIFPLKKKRFGKYTTQLKDTLNYRLRDLDKCMRIEMSVGVRILRLLSNSSHYSTIHYIRAMCALDWQEYKYLCNKKCVPIRSHSTIISLYLL